MEGPGTTSGGVAHSERAARIPKGSGHNRSIIVVTKTAGSKAIPRVALLRSGDQFCSSLISWLQDPKATKTGFHLRHILSSICLEDADIRGPLFDLSLASRMLTYYSPDFASEIERFQIPEEDQNAITAINTLRTTAAQTLEDSEQIRVFEEVEAPLIPVLCDMEKEGIRCDKAQLLELETSITRAIRDLADDILRPAQTAINLDRTEDVGALLYEQLQLCPHPPRTRAGNYATDEETLRNLPTQHPIVDQVLEYRRLTTLKRSYLNILPQAIDPKTQRIHTTFEQLESANGRLVSRNPNLQNIPIRTAAGREIRRAFLPRSDDYAILSADYSQLELRLLAHFSGDLTLIDAFRNGVDVHSATAGKLFQVSSDLVTEQMRSVAKTINYGIAYGMTSFGLARKLGRSVKEARSIIDEYFAALPGLSRYATEIVKKARCDGFVSTVLGRRRYVPEIRAKAFAARRRAERVAISSPIQGTAADLIKLAMIAIHREIRRRKLRTRLLLQVHDELVFDLFKAEKDEVLTLVKEKMASALPLTVPLEVDTGIGANWLHLS